MVACHVANILFFWSWSTKAKRKQRIVGLVAQAVSMVYFVDTGLLEPGIWNLAFMVANIYRLARDWNAAPSGGRDMSAEESEIIMKKV